MKALFLFFALLMLYPIAPTYAARYYEGQSDFSETAVPAAGYRWDRENLQACVFKEKGVSNSYYVWAKLAVQGWRQALREYTGDQSAWDMRAHYVKSESMMQRCDIMIYIYDTYRDFPGYPAQTGAYTSVRHAGAVIESASVYLSPLVLHGDGTTEIELPTYAFRNSAVHEVGHALGLSHNAKEKGYLMSPQFDYFEQDDQLPITTLELGTLVGMYGSDGFG